MRILILNDKMDDNLLFHHKIYSKFTENIALVYNLESIRINSLSLGRTDIQVGDIEITDFDVLHYLNFPRDYKNYFSTSRHEIYKLQEYENAFFAAFFFNGKTKIINKGYALSNARHVFDKYSFIRKLSSFGWNVPKLQTRYDFNLEEYTNRFIYPAPNNDTLFTITLTRNAFFIDNSEKEEYFKYSPNLRNVVQNTQKYMVESGLDLCMIPLSIVNEDIYAYGISYTLPFNMETELATKIITTLL